MPHWMLILQFVCGTAGGVICSAMAPAQRGPDAPALVGFLACIVYSAAPWLVRLLILHVMAFIKSAKIEGGRSYGKGGRR
jgi:hypothetical protein